MSERASAVGLYDKFEKKLKEAELRIDALKEPGGGGTSNGMEPASKEYVDLKLEAAMGRIEGKLASMPSTAAMIATGFTSAVGVIGILLAALAFGGDRFDGGVGLADQRQEQLQRDAAQDAILKRLDALLAAQPTPAPQAPESPSE